MPQKKKTIARKKVAGYNQGGAIYKETKLSPGVPPDEPAPRPATRGRARKIDLDPRSDKTISRLNEEAIKKKIAKDSAKKYRQRNLKYSGRGTGSAELMELHTGGRKKEGIKKKLINSFLDASNSVKNRLKKKTKKNQPR